MCSDSVLPCSGQQNELRDDVCKNIEARIRKLEAGSHATPKPSAASQVDWTTEDCSAMTEWLLDRLTFFDELPPAELATAQHLRQVLDNRSETSWFVDCNQVPFPMPVLSNKRLLQLMEQASLPLGDVEARRLEVTARLHKELEVQLWGNFDNSPLTLPGLRDRDAGGADIGLIQSAIHTTAADHAHERRTAALAFAPEELRAWLYDDSGGSPGFSFDTELPDSSDGPSWVRWAIKFRDIEESRGIVAMYREPAVMSLYGEQPGIIDSDVCTDEQVRVHELRSQDPDFSHPNRVRARANRRNVLPQFLEAHLAPDAHLCVDPANAAALRVEARKQSLEEYERRAEEGAKLVSWPENGRWPAPTYSRSARAAGTCPKSVKQFLASKDYLQAPLIRAVRSGNPHKVRKILEQGCQVKRTEVLGLACQLRTQGDGFKLKCQECVDGVEGSSDSSSRKLSITSMAGHEYCIQANDSTTVEMIKHTIVRASNLPSHATHWLALMTDDGVVLTRPDQLAADIFNRKSDLALTVVVENRGSPRAAEILELLLSATEHYRLKNEFMDNGLHLVKAAVENGNPALVNMMVKAGLDPAVILSRYCNYLSKREKLDCETEVVQTLVLSGAVEAGPHLLRTLGNLDRSDIVESLLGPCARISYVKSALIEHGPRLYRLAHAHHASLAMDWKFWMQLVTKYGFDAVSKILSQDCLESRDFLLNTLQSGRMALKDVPRHLRGDEEIIEAAMLKDNAALTFIPDDAWTPKLALAAARSFASLKGFEHLPAHFWTESLACAAHALGHAQSLAWWLPEQVWTEDLAVKLATADAAPLIPRHVWSPQLARELVSACWEALAFAPEHLLQDEFLREQLVVQLDCSSLELSDVVTSNMNFSLLASTLLKLRKTTTLGQVVSHGNLFSEKREDQLVCGRVAKHLCFEVAALSLGQYEGPLKKTCATNDPTQSPLSHLRAQLPQLWKLKSLKHCSNMPQPCIAVLDAITGLLQEQASWQEVLSDSGAFLKRLLSLDPAEVTPTSALVAANRNFLCFHWSARHLHSWALKNLHEAYALVGLAVWLRGFLGLCPHLLRKKLNDVSMHVNTVELQRLQQHLEDPHTDQVTKPDIPSNSETELRANQAIEQAMVRVEATISHAMEQAQSLPADTWSSHTLKGIATELEKAQALREKAVATLKLLASPRAVAGPLPCQWLKLLDRPRAVAEASRMMDDSIGNCYPGEVRNAFCSSTTTTAIAACAR